MKHFPNVDHCAQNQFNTSFKKNYKNSIPEKHFMEILVDAIKYFEVLCKEV
jgi:hypothetical protein